MLMILVHEKGLRMEAVLVGMSDDRMRIITRDTNDTIELRLIRDQWMTEEGDATDIESVIMTGRSFGRPSAHDYAA